MNCCRKHKEEPPMPGLQPVTDNYNETRKTNYCGTLCKVIKGTVALGITAGVAYAAYSNQSALIEGTSVLLRSVSSVDFASIGNNLYNAVTENPWISAGISTGIVGVSALRESIIEKFGLNALLEEGMVTRNEDRKVNKNVPEGPTGARHIDTLYADSPMPYVTFSRVIGTLSALTSGAALAYGAYTHPQHLDAVTNFVSNSTQMNDLHLNELVTTYGNTITAVLTSVTGALMSYKIAPPVTYIMLKCVDCTLSTIKKLFIDKPISCIKTVGQLIVRAMYALISGCKFIGNVIASGFQFAGSTAVNGCKFVGSTAVSGYNQALSMATRAFHATMGAIGNALTALKDALIAGYQKMVKGLQTIRAFLSNLLSASLTMGKDAMNSIKTIIGKVVTAIQELLKFAANKAIEYRFSLAMLAIAVMFAKPEWVAQANSAVTQYFPGMQTKSVG